MKYIAQIDVMPLKNLLDPQGKAVNQTLSNLHYNNVLNVRIGKHISLELDAKSEEDAKNQAEDICKKVLANQIMEFYSIFIEKA
jgi:phosphoribosylformylglycinamidine synthase